MTKQKTEGEVSQIMTRILPTLLHKLRSTFPPVVCWIFSVGALLRILFFIVGENNGGDALARASMTAEWLRHPGFRLNFEPWLPFHFWFMGGAAAFLHNPELGARMLSLVLGICTLPVLWAVTKVVYGEPPATLSVLGFSLYSLHIGYSTTSSSEAPYLFFLLAGLLGFFIYRKSGSWAAMIPGALSLAVSAGIRYEAWICIFALFVVLLFFPLGDSTGKFFYSAHVRELFVFGTLAGAWPIFWMIYQWRTLGKPLFGVTMNYSWVAQQVQTGHDSMLYNLALPPGVILITLTPFIVAAGLYGLVHGFRRPLGRDFCFLLLLMAAALAYQIIAGGLLPMARYTITVGTLLVIASGLGLHRIAHALPQWGQLHFRGTLAALLVLNLGSILAVSEIHNSLSDKFSAISPRLRFPRPIEGLRQYLKPKVDPDAAIAIDNYNTESNIIASAIGLPLIARSNTFLASSRSLSELPEYMRAREQFYVIYSDKGVFRNAFLLPKVCGVSAITVNGLDFKCLFANETYRVYRVSRAESNNRIVSTQGQGQLNPL